MAATVDNSYSQTLRTRDVRRELSRGEAHWAFGQIMDGQWPEAQIAGLLVALAAKGETAEEIAGAAEAMREHVCADRHRRPGRDRHLRHGRHGPVSTFNISTAAALVAAGAGVKVAKHGNRTTTRASGSADVLAALGVNIDADRGRRRPLPARGGRVLLLRRPLPPGHEIRRAGPQGTGRADDLQPAWPADQPRRRTRQLMGVFDDALTEIIADVLGALGAVQRDGGPRRPTAWTRSPPRAATRVSEFRGGKVTTRTIRPEDFGLPRAQLDDLAVSSAAQSAELVGEVLCRQERPGAGHRPAQRRGRSGGRGQGRVHRVRPRRRPAIHRLRHRGRRTSKAHRHQQRRPVSVHSRQPSLYRTHVYPYVPLLPFCCKPL